MFWVTTAFSVPARSSSASFKWAVQAQHLIPVKPVKLLRPADEIGVAEDRLRRLAVLLVINPVHTSEIGDAALGRYTRSTKKNDIITLSNPLL